MDNYNITQKEIHEAFIKALNGFVLSHSNLVKKPLEIDLKPPLPHKVRLYPYKATYPPGGRALGEHKIQLMVPGQQRGQRASFDYSDGRIVLLGGYRPDLETFILWDADLYTDFSFSRNVQVKAETIYAALAGEIGTQERRIRGNGTEVVLTTRPDLLSQALQLRMELTLKRLIGN